MGIPGFVRRLKEAGYSDSCELGRTESNKLHTNAIIDGPGLAYYIYNKLKQKVNSNSSEPNVLIKHAPYQECNKEIVQFLNGLKSYGIEVKAIFFDGMLPESKYDVRLDRLRKCASSLAGFKILHDSAVKATRSPKVDAQRVFRSPDMIRTRKELPAPPLIVPSAVEYLLGSQYADLVFVVPNEADPFCAALGRLLSLDGMDTTIFTNDSDLIVFDSGKETKVTMLNDLYEVEDGDRKSLKGVTFCPTDIVAKLKHPDLPQLAWLMTQDSHDSVSKITQSMPIKNPPEEYSQFVEQYLPTLEMSDESIYKTLVGDDNKRLLLAGLDARVSEVVEQVKKARELFAHNGSCSKIDTFLPFILEDPSSGSAWEIGADARLSAYTILHASSQFAVESFHEHKRIGRNIGDSSMLASQLLAGDYIEPLRKVVSSYKENAELITSLASVDQWRFIVMQYLTERLHFLGKAIPQDSDITKILAGRPLTDWRLVHLSAQYQAAYYSLRMLAQVLRVVPVTDLPQANSNLFNSIAQMRRLLDGFPRIAMFFGPEAESEEALQVEYSKWMHIVAQYTQNFRKLRAGGDSDDKKRKAKKTKSEPKAKRVNVKGGHSASSNPFSALADE